MLLSSSFAPFSPPPPPLPGHPNQQPISLQCSQKSLTSLGTPLHLAAVSKQLLQAHLSPRCSVMLTC